MESLVERQRVKVGRVQPRRHVVLTGIVVRVDVAAWVGGPVLEAQLRDETGTICLAFLGRRSVGGVEPGALMTVEGTVGRHCDRPVILNPRLWLGAPATQGAPASRAGSVDIAAMARDRRRVRTGNA